MKTISIINLKGGVGKTVSSINIAHILSYIYNLKVLIIDNDKQGNASKIMRAYSSEGTGTHDMLTDRHVNIKKLIRSTEFGIDLIPCNMSLIRANLEVMLDQQHSQQNRFARALQTVQDRYDVCIIDNAPDINISTINALVASDYVMVPVTIDDFALDGLKELTEQINDVKEDHNTSLTFSGCFITNFDRECDAHIQGEDLLRGMDYPVFATKVRKTAKMAQSTFERRPILLTSPRCAAAYDYKKLTAEIVEKCHIMAL